MTTDVIGGGWLALFGGPTVCAPSDRPAGLGARMERPRDHEAHGRPVRRADGRTDDPQDAASDASTTHDTMLGGVSASELVARLRASDRDALATIYLALRVPLWRLAMILVRSADTADEIVQNVFFALWMRRDGLAAQTDLLAYLNTAVRNAVRQLGRHGRVVGGVESAVEQHAIAMPAHGSMGPAPDAAAEHDDFLRAYQRALATLSEREQVALTLRWEEEQTFEAIGAVLGLSKVGARTIVMRAESKVRVLLAEYRT